MPKPALVLLLGPLFLGSLLLSGCGVGDFDLTAHERFEKTVPLDPTGRFRLQNVNGTVTVETWSQNQVQIEAEKAASHRSLLEDIRIDVRGQGDEVEVETHFPRGGFFFSGYSKVDYHIKLPAEARVEVRTVNGSVRTEGVGGAVRANSVNGTVKIADAGGVVEASTVNGSIQAAYRKLAEGSHKFSTTNGSVTLYLPDNAGGEFEARTVNGGISTDFPLTVSGWIGNRHLKGRLGEGRGIFSIRTVNGSVKLLKAHEKVVRRNLLKSGSPLCGRMLSVMPIRRWSWSILPPPSMKPSGWRPSWTSTASTTPCRWSNTAPA